MKKILKISFALLCFGAFYAGAQNMNTPDHHMNHSMKKPVPSNMDEYFIREAAMAGKKEVVLGDMAKTKAYNKRVKNFAEMMVRDHTKANAALKPLAEKRNIALAENMNIDQMKNTLAKKTGEEFDIDYMHMMVDDHKKAVSLFAKESKEGAQSDVKAFAAKMIPILKMHLDSAQTIYTDCMYMGGKKNIGMLIK
jgi:putative membrane protein